jgi:hypothetical protein
MGRQPSNLLVAVDSTPRSSEIFGVVPFPFSILRNNREISTLRMHEFLCLDGVVWREAELKEVRKRVCAIEGVAR